MNRFIYKIIFILKGIKYFPKFFIFRKINKKLEQEKNNRINNYIDNKFQRLFNLKNKFEGKRCFIVCTGPSLKLEDLDLIKNEISFSMNSIIGLYNKTDWRPNYYCIQDQSVFYKLKDEILKIYPKNSNVFIRNSFFQFVEDKNYIYFPYNNEYHAYATICGKYRNKFSENAYGIVYDGGTITYSIIQLAYYMGFKEMYLLGCDCIYVPNQKNHIVDIGLKDKYMIFNYKRMTCAFETAKKFAEENNFEIFNATRGGNLEVFKRVTLEDIINQNGKYNDKM